MEDIKRPNPTTVRIGPGVKEKIPRLSSLRSKVDRQVSGLAGEFFVAAELLKRGVQTSVTLGNAKSIDLLAYNPVTDRAFQVQVKTLRSPNYFPLGSSAIKASHIYVFVLLNTPDSPPRYFIVPGQFLIDNLDLFGTGMNHPTFPGIHSKYLQSFESHWHHFTDLP